MPVRIALAASLALAIVVSAPSRTVAQGVAPAGPVISLPDTLGANFPLADSATKTGSLADYNTLVGTWTFRFQTRQPTGFKAPITGHWTFEKKPGGGLQRAHGVITRMRYLALSPDHFVWRSDRSYDNGTTWIRDFAVLEATRVGK
jgi:hypothetical protein